MRRLRCAIAIALFVAACSHEVAPGPEPITTSFELQSDMRVLWTQHVLWTRMVLISAIAGLPDAQHAIDRLLANQDDIGDAIRPFYGDEAGDALSELLRAHITIALDVVQGAAAGDAEDAIAAWYANGDEIAGFLASANPHWDVEELRAMMRAHLDQTIAAATARLTGDWEGDVAAADEITAHALHMADALAAGIALQFPELVAESELDPSEQELRLAMRALWEDHAIWTRIFIVTSVAALDDAPVAAQRLLRNQDEIGAAIAPYYGEAAGDELARLLREHIAIAADVVTGAASGDEAATEAALEAWYANADDIARFLSDANPSWPFEDLQSMMHAHLEQTTTEATARLTGEWAADVEAYDEVEQHLLHMADALSSGILAQHGSH